MDSSRAMFNGRGDSVGCRARIRSDGRMVAIHGRSSTTGAIPWA